MKHLEIADKLDKSSWRKKTFDCKWREKRKGIKNYNECEKCRVCRYLNFLDYCSTVGVPDGTTIQYDRDIEYYLKIWGTI
jgi:hypothetical protein